MSFILLQYVPVPVLKNLGKIAIFFLKNRHILTICFWFCFYTKPALFCLTPSSLFLSAQNSKQKKSLNHRIIIIHNPIKKSELIPPPLKSSDDPFDPLHIRLVEMFRFVFKNWKKYALIWQEKLFKRSKLAKYKLCAAVRIWPMVWKTSWLFEFPFSVAKIVDAKKYLLTFLQSQKYTKN